MASRDPNRPNVLFIISDDQGPWALHCAGNREIRTPALDALAASGIRFDEFFCVSPVCSPARASLLTGDIPSRHGVHDWIRTGSMGDTRIDYLQGQTLIHDLAAKAGYRCALIGKWHLGASDVPRPSFVRWFAHQAGMGPYYDAPMVDHDRPCTVPGYITDVLADAAGAFVQEELGNASPFWLSLNFTAPHYPWIDSHPPEYTELYRDCPFESCPDEPPHPWFIGGKAALERGRSERRASLIGYFAAVTAMDAAIGRVLSTLQTSGLAASTLVLFMSDNGMNCGHHGIWGKGNGTRPQNMYDTSVKVPCIIAQPGRVRAGEVNRDLLSGYDVFPTLIDHLRLDHAPATAQPGRSFAHVLTGNGSAGHEEVVVYDEYGPVRMVRTHDWKYVHRHPSGPHELFDLRHDPGERHNVVDEARTRSVVLHLRERMERWFERHADAARDGRDKGVTGCGQLARVDAEHRGAAFAHDHTQSTDWDLWLEKRSA